MVSEPVKPTASSRPAERVGKLDLNEAVEKMEEEIEYEEVEEEIEEGEEIEEEVVEEEVAEVEETCDKLNHVDDGMKVDEKDEDESAKHAELLALPPHGSEVYVGGIPRDVSEEDLRGFCESVGEVFEVRLIKDKDSSENKGFAFVTYNTEELATKAAEDLNNREFMGMKIKCAISQAKHRLFISNVPRNWMEENMKKAMSEVGPGVTRVQVVKDPQNSSLNRGYAFIEYYNGACANYSRKKMSSPNFKLDDNAPTVSWAIRKTADFDSNSQIKSVYVNNLPKNVTQDQLTKLFEHHGKITMVVLPPAKPGQEYRFGFVHFADRSSAMKAVKNTEKYEIDGQILGCSLAKPRASDKPIDTGANSMTGPLLPNYALGYGLVGGAYGTLPADYAQPMAYGRAPNPRVAMVPMILPDGRLGYVLQQPGSSTAAVAAAAASPRSRGRNGRSVGGQQQNNDRSRSRRYHPY